MSHRANCLCLLATIGLLVCSTMSLAAPPRITAVQPRGLRIGATTTITVQGSDLLPAPKLVLPFAVTDQEILANATKNQVQVAVTLDENILPGIYSLRLAGASGISDRVKIGVDRLASQPFSGQPVTLPVALHGQLTGSTILRTAFSATKGQRVVVDVESQRLGAQLKPVLRVYDRRGAQVAWSPPRRSISGDPRLEMIAPADGEYNLELHDVLYRGAAPGFFRLKIGDLRFADTAFPLGVSFGNSSELEFASTNINPAKKFELNSQGVHAMRRLPAMIDVPKNFTGARPLVTISDHVEAVEADIPNGGSLQRIPAAPVAINGRIAIAKQEDRYLLSVTPGSKLRLEVQAARAGSALDGVLILRGEKGNQLVRNDDRPNTSDPALDYNVPNHVEKLVVAIHDLQGRGGRDFVYRIVIQDLGNPDYRLTVETDRVNIPAGGTQVIKVQAQRSGYDGPIALSFPGLPDKIQVSGNRIAAGSTLALVSLTSTSATPVSGLFSIVGKGRDIADRLAIFTPASASWQQHAELGWAVGSPAPVRIAWQDKADNAPLYAGSSRAFQVQVTRPPNVAGPVRIRFLTTQIPPTKKIKKNNKEQVVNDTERTLRSEPVELAEGDQQAVVKVIVPKDLPEREWGVVLIAEHLSADKSKVISTAFTPTRVVSVVQAMRLELTGSSKIEVRAGAEDPSKLIGKLTRAADFNYPVTVSLTGLPEGYSAPSIQIKAGQTDFELPVKFPATAAGKNLRNLRLSATALIDAVDPTSAVQSNEVKVQVKVLPKE